MWEQYTERLSAFQNRDELFLWQSWSVKLVVVRSSWQQQGHDHKT